MSIGDITNIVTSGNQAQVPDLDWFKIDINNKDNIPSSNNVEIIPQLKDAWTHTQAKGAQLVPNQTSIKEPTVESYSSKDIQGVVDTAKKEMMQGVTGKGLANKLASTYPQALVVAAKEDLKKIAFEQGLLGNVYIDLSAYNTCKDAANHLGSNKIRLAKYASGQPKKATCGCHDQGYCKELRKKVVASMEYTEDVFSDYSDHLKVAGLLQADEKVDSKESLRAAFLRKPAKKKTTDRAKAKKIPRKTFDEVQQEFVSQMNKKAAELEEKMKIDRFYEVRPVLSFIQNEMLKGKMGSSLKESISKKYTNEQIRRYSAEISKLANLQGLLGNVYVDISLYKDANEAISAIKDASTNPTYIIQTVQKNEFDDLINKVAKATGCLALPRDGKIDKKIAYSYIQDLQFTDRISSDKAEGLRSLVESNGNVLGIIRNAFLASVEHKKVVKEGGVKATLSSGFSKKKASSESLRTAAVKSLEAGVSVESLENKLSNYVPTTEAVGMVRSIISSMKEVDANILDKCTSERYQLNREAVLKKASKCSNCVLSNYSTCMGTGLKFKGASDTIDLKIDPKTQKVMLDNCPSEIRMDVNQEYDMGDNFGSGMNVALDSMRKSSELDADNSYSTGGLDLNLSE